MLCRFVKDLHNQLVTCMNKLVDELQQYKSEQSAKIVSRDDRVRKELNDAQHIISDIDQILQSQRSMPYSVASGEEVVKRSIEFFKNCYDISQRDAEFSYLDFVPSGRLFVRPEHLGYLRLCDATPSEVDLKLVAGDSPVCKRECTAVIETNRTSCTDAEPYLDTKLSNSSGSLVPIRMRNNKDGSYSVIFTPNEPGIYKLHVSLFGLTVSSSPLEIFVADEAVTPNWNADFRTPNLLSSGSWTSPGTSAQHNSTISAVDSQYSPLDRKSATSLARNFDRGTEYFPAPESASTGKKAVPAKQLGNSAVRKVHDHGDCEEVRASFTNLSVEPTRSSTGRRSSSSTQSPSTIEAQTSVHIPPRSTSVSYVSNARLEFEDLTCVTDEDFDSLGLTYHILIVSDKL